MLRINKMSAFRTDAERFVQAQYDLYRHSVIFRLTHPLVL